MPVSEDVFDTEVGVGRWTLTNRCGGVVQIINYGATITSFRVPARDGEIVDVVLGYDDIRSYKSSEFYVGSTIGRCANRIGGASFHLDAREFRLAANNGVNHLHGGNEGFDKRIWRFHGLHEDRDKTSLSLRLLSPDGDEDYPGNVCVTVTFSLASDANTMSVCYDATTDAPTILNLTNHSYFNLSGHENGTIYDQNLQVLCSNYLKTDDSGLSIGDPVSVDGTCYDYRQPVMLGYRLELMVTAQNPFGGLDNSFTDFVPEESKENPDAATANSDTNTTPGSDTVCRVCSKGVDALRTAAVLTSDVKKIRLKVMTTKPAVHVYSGNYLSGSSVVGKGGARYARHCGICFETQIHPDAINRPEFPSTILRPGQTYHHSTVFDVAERPSLRWS